MQKRSLRFTQSAIADLTRLHAFLQAKNPDAAKRSGQAIAHALMTLEELPERGRPSEFSSEYRELLIDFAASGYAALYRLTDKHVVVLAIRHQREAGYRANP